MHHANRSSELPQIPSFPQHSWLSRLLSLHARCPLPGGPPAFSGSGRHPSRINLGTAAPGCSPLPPSGLALGLGVLARGSRAPALPSTLGLAAAFARPARHFPRWRADSLRARAASYLSLHLRLLARGPRSAQTTPCSFNELFTADKATGTLLRKRPTGWRARQTDRGCEGEGWREGGREERERGVCARRGRGGRREAGSAV